MRENKQGVEGQVRKNEVEVMEAGVTEVKVGRCCPALFGVCSPR
jgi:hypothetical protein